MKYYACAILLQSMTDRSQIALHAGNGVAENEQQAKGLSVESAMEKNPGYSVLLIHCKLVCETPDIPTAP